MNLIKKYTEILHEKYAELEKIFSARNKKPRTYEGACLVLGPQLSCAWLASSNRRQAALKPSKNETAPSLSTRTTSLFSP
jgi:hypothetical protein